MQAAKRWVPRLLAVAAAVCQPRSAQLQAADSSSSSMAGALPGIHSTTRAWSRQAKAGVLTCHEPRNVRAELAQVPRTEFIHNAAPCGLVAAGPTLSPAIQRSPVLHHSLAM